MVVKTHPWENSLLSLAEEAWHSAAAPAPLLMHTQDEIDDAYRQCEELTSIHSRSFHLASRLLPPTKRRAVRALYAFCRITDDIVDEGGVGQRGAEQAEASLQHWRREALHDAGNSSNPVVIAWTDARVRYRIPRRYAEQLIDGVSQDLDHQRYASFADLSEYCYGVASTVGLMSMHITGFAGPDALPYAVKLGVALQMTNILRDIREDRLNGRVYLPQDELDAFGLDEEDIAEASVTERWRSFMRFQIERNRQLYQEAWPGIGLLDVDGRMSIAAATELYRGILDDIESHDFDVFKRRAFLSKWGKIRRLPGIWWRSKTVRVP